MSVLRMSDLPSVGCSIDQALEFAATYNAYNQIAAEPETLSAMYEPIRRVWKQTGRSTRMDGRRSAAGPVVPYVP